MKVEGSVALVTGANRGIGRALAEALLERGAAKVYAGVRDVSTVTDPRLVPIIDARADFHGRKPGSFEYHVHSVVPELWCRHMSVQPHVESFAKCSVQTNVLPVSSILCRPVFQSPTNRNGSLSRASAAPRTEFQKRALATLDGCFALDVPAGM